MLSGKIDVDSALADYWYPDTQRDLARWRCWLSGPQIEPALVKGTFDLETVNIAI
jgi:hypothetical protein